MSESYTPEYLALAERFRPVFARIAEGVVERENTRTLPLEPLRWLKEAGFGTVRIPVADGGEGTVEAMVAATQGRVVQVTVTGPLGEPVHPC